MNLHFNRHVASTYRSKSQIARVLTETWVAQNMYCPRCGNSCVTHLKNNQRVADFICPACNNQYELKSKSGSLGKKIAGGAYNAMIERITGNDNPDFLIMIYSSNTMTVQSLIFIPKHFFTPDIVEKRKPLAATARRAGWVGCNILINNIPNQGKISIISQGVVSDKNSIIDLFKTSKTLETDNISGRRWLMDVLNCINSIKSDDFTLKDVYLFEENLRAKHPKNNHIKAKIRQQLQILREKGFIEFTKKGCYKKINSI